MSLVHILIFSVAGLAIHAVHSGVLRRVLLFCLSILAIYSLQPALALRAFDFWLPTTAIAMAFWVWIATRDAKSPTSRQDRGSLVLLLLLLVGIVASSYLPKSFRLFVSLPVSPIDAALVLVVYGLVGWGIQRLKGGGIRIDVLLVWAILASFIGLKAPGLTLALSRAARALTGQSVELASLIDLNWLGFSYVAFRLIHILRDHRSGRLPALAFQDFFLYLFFFPALSAGPIDRVERFIKDLNQDRNYDRWAQFRLGSTRILRGLFLKFVLADSLALVALNPYHINLVRSSMWLWILLYLYSFRIFFDFSGYTDIAIGIGILAGIRLPENFNQPYRQSDIGAFWNRWHITLAQWFRAYVFSPVTRSLRGSVISKSPWVIILIGQLVTMILIGLWHGITWNFFVWGLWHAMGLFIHNRWLEFQRILKIEVGGSRLMRGARTTAGWILTFNFVSLGWVWFSIPDMQTAWSVFLKLFGGSLG